MTEFKGLLVAVAAMVAIRALVWPLNLGPDMDLYWVPWARFLTTAGLSELYQNPTYDYGPSYAYFLWAAAKTHQALLSSAIAADDAPLRALLKLPPVLGDLALSLLIFAEARRLYGYRAGLASLLLFGLHPGVIMVSVLWAQTDSLLALAVFLSLFFLARGRLALAAVAFAAGLLLKPQAVVAVAVLVPLALRWSARKRLLGAAAAFVGTGAVLSAPFVLSGQLGGLSQAYVTSVDRYPYLAMYALNGWFLVSVLTGNVSDAIGPSPLTYKHIGLAALGLFAAGVAWLSHQRWHERDTSAPYFATFIVFLGFFMLPTQMHERWLFYALPFLAVAGGGERRLRMIYLVLGATFILGLAFALAGLKGAWPQDLWGAVALWAVLCAAAVNIVSFLWSCAYGLSLGRPCAQDALN